MAPVSQNILKIRVLCVDDSEDVTAALGLCMAQELDIECVGALNSADDLVMEVIERRADVVLLDMTMPGNDPLAALSRLVAVEGDRDSVRVLVFSGADNRESADLAAAAGACGFVSKQADIPVILDAIREAARWHRGTDPFVVRL